MGEERSQPTPPAPSGPTRRDLQARAAQVVSACLALARPGSRALGAARPGEADAGQSRASLNRQVIGIAWPVIVENLLHTLLGVVNLWMVSRIGVDAIAGVGSALQYLMVGFAGLGAIGVGSTVLVAHAAGAGDRAAAGRIAKQSLELGITVGLVLSVVGWVYAYPANIILGVTPEVAEIGAIYLRITAAGAVPLVLMFIVGAIIRGTGDSRTPMQVTLVANLVSAVLSYVLIFGGPGLPALGVTGAALGAALSRVVGAALLLRLLLVGRSVVDLSVRGGWRPDPTILRRILSIGIPSGMEQFLISGGFLLLSVIIARMGTSVLAAHRVVFQALAFSNMPGMGFGIAATTLTGIHMGAKRVDLAEAATWIATRWAVIWMGTLAAVFFFFGEPIMLLFAPDEPEVVHYGAQALKVMALTQPFFALTNGLTGGLRGAGDTRYPMYLAALGMWLIRLPGAYLLGLTAGLGLPGAYASSIVDAALRAAVFLRRYRAGKWKSLDVSRGLGSRPEAAREAPEREPRRAISRG